MRLVGTPAIRDRRLFTLKLAALCVGTMLFVPLVYLKWRLPAYLYAGGLIGLHGYFLYLYAARTPWHILIQSKRAFAARMAAVIFFIYLLSLIHFGGTALHIAAKLAAAFMIHAAILLGLMLGNVSAPAAALANKNRAVVS